MPGYQYGQEVFDILRGTSNALPPEVKQVLQHATAQNPRERYSIVKNLLADFMQAVHNYQARRQREVQTSSFDLGKTQKVPPITRSSGRPSFLGNPTRWRQRIVALYAILATFVIVGLAALLFVQSRPATYPIKLKGLDLGAYCASYGMSAGISACSSPVDMNAACKWQWGRTDLHNVFSNSTDSDSGICYDSHNHPVMGSGGSGINDMKGYCNYRFHYGVELRKLSPAAK